MKRFLFAGLFVCALCLVNVANAEYKWSSDAPAPNETETWTLSDWSPVATITFEGQGGNASVQVTGLGDGVTITYLLAKSPSAFEITLSEASGLYGSDYFKFERDPVTNVNHGVISIGVEGFEDFEWDPTDWGTEYLYAVDADPISSILFSNLIRQGSDGGKVTFKVYAAVKHEDTNIDPENPYPTPEPASMLIFGLGLAGLGLCRRMRKI